MRLLTRTDVQRAIRMPEAIESVRHAYIALSTGRAQIPPRAAITVPAYGGVSLFMPGYLPGDDAHQETVAIKIVSVHDRNPARGLDRINALVAVFDPETGLPRVLMEAGYLTALRTGAGTGVATDLLARRDACRLALFGAGVQARTQLMAVAAVRSLRQCRIFSPNPEKSEAMILELRTVLDSSIELLPARTPAEAIQNADIICTATNSPTPVFDGTWLQPGTHINAIGTYQPERREVDSTTMKRCSKIVVDTVEGAMSEAGDLLIPIQHGDIQESHIYAEIGEIAAGLKPGRETELEITFFKSVGNAAQDVAVAEAVYRRAVVEDLGVEIDL
jgi:alanine dehydrogenase